MTQKRPWTIEQDRLLKYVFQNSKLTKWSHIARKLNEQHGIKGRNGKQCKERYATHIDTTYPREQWSYQDEQKMVDYHNELGNKWAIIGNKLGGRSDNCVKNHFYSLLRKSLRKINKVIQTLFRKEYKQFNPNVLYRIVQVSEQKFKLVPNYQPHFNQSSQQLKNDLIDFSYDDEIGAEEDIDVQTVKQFISRIMQFAAMYKRRSKKDRKGSDNTPDLLTPTRYPKGLQYDKEQSEGNSILFSSDTSNIEDISDDQINRGSYQQKQRKNSVSSVRGALSPEKSMRSRARSQSNLNHRFSYTESANYQMQDQNQNMQIKISQQFKGDISNILGQQGIRSGMQMLKQEQNGFIQFQMNQSKPRVENYVEPQEYHYPDSGIQMRILPFFEIQEYSSHEQDIL